MIPAASASLGSTSNALLGCYQNSYLLQVSLTILRVVTRRSPYSSLLDAFLNPSLFLFFILFCFCFAGSGTSDRHLVADMLVKLNANAPQAPDLAVFADDGKFARLVAFLQAPGYGLGMTPEFLICFSFACGYGLAFCSANFRKERPGCRRNWHFAQQQSPSSDVRSIYRLPGIIVLTERCTFQCEPGERTFGTGVGQDLCIHLPICTGLSMSSHWTRCCRSVASNLEITGEQPLHTFFILNDHYHVHSFDTDLQPPASAGNRDERWRTPAIRRAAGGYAFASFGSEDKAAFDHVRHNGYAFGVLQHFFRDSLVGHSYNFVHHLFGAVQPVGGIFPRRRCPAQRAETQHRKYEHYFFHGTASFLYQCASLAFGLCVHSHADPHRYAGRTWTVLTVTNQDSGGLSNNAHLIDRKSTRLNSSHANISYAVF